MNLPAELTDAELLVLRAMLHVLTREPRGFTEPAWQGFTESHLGGEHLALEDFNRLRDLCAARGYVLGAAHPITRKQRWAITQAGQLALSQLES